MVFGDKHGSSVRFGGMGFYVLLWRRNEYTIHKVFVLNQKVKSIILDPNLETADIDKANGKYPRVKERSRFGQFKDSQE